MNEFVTMTLSSGKGNPVVGIITLIVIFGGIIWLSMTAVKNAGNGGAKKIKQTYGDKILEEGTFLKSMHYYLTKDEFLVQKYNAVFAAYRLSDLRYIGIRWDATQRLNVLYMTDADKKAVKPAQVIGGTKAAQKLYGGSMPAMKQAEAEKLRDVIIKYAPHVQYEEKQ